MHDHVDERELDVVALTETWLGEDETTPVSELCGEDCVVLFINSIHVLYNMFIQVSLYNLHCMTCSPLPPVF